MRNATMMIVGAAAMAMLGAYLAQPRPASAGGADGVSELHELNRNVERLTRAVEEAGKSCNR
jgi:hypothetical protein